MFTRRFRALLLTTGLFVGFAGTACPASAQNAPSYQVDTTSSRVYILVNRATRLGHSHGVEGRLKKGYAKLGGTGRMVFDMTTFIADTPAARRYVGLEPNFSASDARKVNQNMRGSACLDVNSFPTATFAVTSIRPAGGQSAGAPGRYVFSGQFTLHGVTHPIRFAATLAKTTQPGVLTMRGAFRINQSSFGITPYSALAGLIRVQDELTIYGNMVLRQAGR